MKLIPSASTPERFIGWVIRVEGVVGSVVDTIVEVVVAVEDVVVSDGLSTHPVNNNPVNNTRRRRVFVFI